jgi:hypothetical protein
MNSFASLSKRVATFVTGSVVLTGLAGCGLGGSSFHVTNAGQSGSSSTGSSLNPAVIAGAVHGGQQPVTGATLQLYAAGAPAMPSTGSTGTGGYGQGASALITAGTLAAGSASNFSPGGASGCIVPMSGVNTNNCTALPQTDSSGNFTLSSDYTCTSGQLIYLVATGGNPGLSGTVSNPYLALMAGLGTCPASGTLSSTVPSVNINEVTTIATVWSLQQFMAPPSGVAASATTSQGGTTSGVGVNVGAPSGPAGGYGSSGVQTSVIGLQNAFGMINNMVNLSTGSAAAPTNTWATSETLRINGLADVLASCVNTDGATSTACSTLMADVTPSGLTKSADTIQAAFYIAQNPGLKVSTIYALGVPTAPFPAGSTPNDFTLAVNLAPTYTSGSNTVFGVAAPHHVAIDLYGNAWLSNNSFTTGIAGFVNPGSSVVELAPSGNILMNPVTSFTASTTGGSYSQFTTKPTSNSVSYTVPRMVAIDTSNNVWVANYNASTGTPAAGSVGLFKGSSAVGVAGSVNGGYYVGKFPWGLAIDGNNNVYVTNTATASTSVLDGQSIGKIVASTGAYTYSTSGGNGSSTSTQLPNVLNDSNLGNGLSSAVIAIDTNTFASGGTNGLLWSVSPACLMTSGNFDSTATIPWGVVSIFDADNLSPASASQATTAFSNATLGAGSTTNCGTSTYTGAGLTINQTFTAAMALPYGIAIDRNNGVWIADDNNNGTNVGFNGLTYLQAPTASTGNIPGSAYEAVGYSTGGTVTSAGNTLGSSSTPGNSSIVRAATYDEVDGNNNVWVAGQGVPFIGEASYNASTNTVNFIYSSQNGGWNHTFSNAYGLAIDPSGNVWIANSNTSGTNTYAANSTGPLAGIPVGCSMTVIVGAAGPLVTPLSLAVKSSMLGQKP